jgi:hypothetical protein
MKTIPCNQDVLDAIETFARREGWTSKALFAAADSAGYAFDEKKPITELLKGSRHPKFGKAFGMTGRKWSRAIGYVHTRKPKSMRELLVMMRAGKIPSSEHNVAQAFHAAGIDGVPDTRIAEFLAAIESGQFGEWSRKTVAA